MFLLENFRQTNCSLRFGAHTAGTDEVLLLYSESSLILAYSCSAKGWA